MKQTNLRTVIVFYCYAFVILTLLIWGYVAFLNNNNNPNGGLPYVLAALIYR